VTLVIALLLLGFPLANFLASANNLISNAIKYTESGGVTVRVRNDAEGAGVARARVEVVDTGLGLDPAERELAFHEFERLHADGSVEGAGLGLAISQLVAQRLGGDVLVDSTLGAGSTFALVLPGSWVDRAAFTASPAQRDAPSPVASENG
jgi:signal transduction histidine kinase